MAFACVAAGTVFALVRSRALRAGAVLYVALVVAVIVATANHFWLDAVGGAAAALVGLADRQSSVRSPSAARVRPVEAAMTVIPITKRSRAVVIGAGLGGLAVALRLQGAGLRGDGARAALRARRPGRAPAR